MSHLLSSCLLHVLGHVYGLVWRLIRPVLRRNRRLADGFSQRLVPDDWFVGAEPVATASNNCAGCDVWIQAASGGEARLVGALVGALRRRLTSSHPCTLLATTWTRQGLDVLAHLAAEQQGGSLTILPRFVPFDEPGLMRRALQQARPRLAVLLETELWPGLLLACADCHVPVLVLNGRMRQTTLRTYLPTSVLWRTMAPAEILAIAEEDASRFAALFPGTKVSVVPNMKFDLAAEVTVATGCRSTRDLQSVLGDPAVPTVLLASVREEEESLLCTVLQQGLQRGALFAPGRSCAAARLVIAPRHMHRLDAWKRHCEVLGLSWRLRSSGAAHDGGHAGEVVLWDTFGELPVLYALSDAVFVGGSLVPLGGQNFLEPLSAGIVPCVGPHTENFAWVLGGAPDGSLSLDDLNLRRVVPDSAALYDMLAEAVARGPLSSVCRQTVHKRFTSWLETRVGGADTSAAAILRYLQ